FERKHATGEVIAGTITKLVPFGAFVRVGEGVEGLVHISELSDQHVESPEQVVQVGEQVRVKVVDVDVPRRRISLSIRRVAEEPELVPEEEFEAEASPEPIDTGEAAEQESSPELAPEPSLEAEPPDAGAVDRAVPLPEPAPAASQPEPAATEEPEDVSLESIVEELKRREGRGSS